MRLAFDRIPLYIAHGRELVINRIVHAYKDIFSYFKDADGFGSSGSCNNNVNCPEGEPWQGDKLESCQEGKLPVCRKKKKGRK